MVDTKQLISWGLLSKPKLNEHGSNLADSLCRYCRLHNNCTGSVYNDRLEKKENINPLLFWTFI